MRVEVKVEVARPRKDVWAFLADSENLPRWSDDFASCERDPADRDPIGRGARFHYRLNAPARAGSFEYVEFEPSEHLRWEGEPIKATGGTMRPCGGYELQDAEDGFRTLVCLVFEPRFGGALRLLSPLIRRSIHRGRTADAARLKEILERG
jgi:uncharacterized protein YndB with AHSA1/START domain